MEKAWIFTNFQDVVVQMSRKKFSKRIKKGGNLLETIFFETIFSIDTKGENKYSLA